MLTVQYAVKVIDKKEVDETRLRMEVEILKKVKHPNIISLKEVYDEDPKKLYLVMELVTGGELFNKIVEIGSYSENTAKRSAFRPILCVSTCLELKQRDDTGS